MAGIFNKILDVIGLEEETVDEVETMESQELKVETISNESKFERKSKKKDANVFNVYKNNTDSNLIIYRPVSCDDASHMIDSLKSKKPVIANFESIDHEKAQRILDMMSGAMYAISGSVHKVSKCIYVFAPENLDVTGDSNKDVANVSSIFMDISK